MFTQFKYTQDIDLLENKTYYLEVSQFSQLNNKPMKFDGKGF